jgi:flavin-dependent dehydrogenase
MRKQDADVVVVGLGPVGAYTAWRLAAQGLRVVALEARPAAEPPSSIGVFHFEQAAFARTDLPPPPPAQVVCSHQGMTIHAPDPRLFVEVSGVETLALDLNWFIDGLRERARKAGAKLLYGCLVDAPVRDGGRLAGVQARGPRGAFEYRAPVVVDATGLARTLRRESPAMSLHQGDRDFCVYMEYWTDPQNPPADGLHSYTGLNAWTAKYPGYWVVGIGRPAPLKETKAAHAAWVRERLPGDKRVQRAVIGEIPYAYSPPSLVDDGLVVVGDAAAANKPFSGEGVASGMALARLAAEEIPRAVAAGGSRGALWEINRRYFVDQGAKFAFLRAMGLGLMSLSADELNYTFEIGMVAPDDLRQTFLDYHVEKSPLEWAPPILRLVRRPTLAAKYAAAIARAARLSQLYKAFPAEKDFEPWRRKLLRALGG